MFVIVHNVGIIINADVKAYNLLIREYVIKDLFGIPIIVNVNMNVTNYAMLESINIINIVNREKD